VADAVPSALFQVRMTFLAGLSTLPSRRRGRRVLSAAAPSTWALAPARPARSFDQPSTLADVPAASSFDPHEMIARFRQRAEAVRTRGMPPIEGAERQRFREQAQRDYSDFAMIGDAEAELLDGILTLRIDLRPRPAEAAGPGEES
jgi:hypothetical protein